MKKSLHPKGNGGDVHRYTIHLYISITCMRKEDGRNRDRAYTIVYSSGCESAREREREMFLLFYRERERIFVRSLWEIVMRKTTFFQAVASVHTQSVILSVSSCVNHRLMDWVWFCLFFFWLVLWGELKAVGRSSFLMDFIYWAFNCWWDEMKVFRYLWATPQSSSPTQQFWSKDCWHPSQLRPHLPHPRDQKKFGKLPVGPTFLLPFLANPHFVEDEGIRYPVRPLFKFAFTISPSF